MKVQDLSSHSASHMSKLHSIKKYNGVLNGMIKIFKEEGNLKIKISILN